MSKGSFPNGEKLCRELEQQGAQKIKLAVVDIDGILRGKYVHFDKFRSAASKGFGFCNVVFGWDSSDVCYDKSSYTGWHSGYPDALAIPDLATHRKKAWDDNVDFFIADFYQNDGEQPLAICPRQTLKRVLKSYADLKLSPLAGLEFEWFNFEETPQSIHDKSCQGLVPISPGMFGYSLLRASLKSQYFHDLFHQLLAFGIPLEGIHTETGPGVYEAAIQVSEALEAADRAVLFKASAKEIALRHQIMPSFMARWNRDLPGCSGHIHISLNRDGKNLFYDAKDPHCMSELMKSFLAGLLKYTPELLVMMAPTVNSYKRLVKGYWAPTSSNWGIDNRTCAFRIIAGGESSTRIEVRVPGADINPYLALAAALAAGLGGIQEKLKLEQPPIQGSGYEDTKSTEFASNLLEASLKLRQSEHAKQTFGEEFVQHYTETRLWEWQQSQKVVTDWELKRYFEII